MISKPELSTHNPHPTRPTENHAKIEINLSIPESFNISIAMASFNTSQIRQVNEEDDIGEEIMAVKEEGREEELERIWNWADKLLDRGEPLPDPSY